MTTTEALLRSKKIVVHLFEKVCKCGWTNSYRTKDTLKPEPESVGKIAVRCFECGELLTLEYQGEVK